MILKQLVCSLFLTNSCVLISHSPLLQLFHLARNPLFSQGLLFKTCGYPSLLSFSSNLSFLPWCFLKTPCQSFLPLFAPLSSAFTVVGTRKNVLTFFCNPAGNPFLSTALFDRCFKFQFLLLKHLFWIWSLFFLTGPHKYLMLTYKNFISPAKIFLVCPRITIALRCHFTSVIQNHLSLCLTNEHWI